MIARTQIANIVMDSLPQVREDIADMIADEIVSEIEVLVRSMIRQKIVDQRKQLYVGSIKKWEASEHGCR